MKRSAGCLAALAFNLTFTLIARPLHAAPAQPAFTWSNPLPFEYSEGQAAPRREIRDPCIVREGDRYWLVFTMWPFRGREEAHLAEPDAGGSPGIALYSSPDLKAWKFENWLVKSSDLPADCPYKHRFWAPEIHKIAGKFYLIFTADNWLKPEHNPAGSWGSAGYSFVGVADRIAGPYRHINYLPGGACDTTLFGDTDGRTYAFIPAMDVFVQEIDLGGIEEDRVRLIGERRKIVTADNSDIGMKARPEYLEGPWAMKIGGRYVLLFAGPYSGEKFPGNEGYWTGAAYAESVTGPWKKDPRGQVFHGGHLAAFHGPGGRSWFSYRSEKERQTRGLLSIDPFDLDPAGVLRCDGPSTRPSRSRPRTRTTCGSAGAWSTTRRTGRAWRCGSR